jgi:hypothetical protein
MDDFTARAIVNAELEPYGIGVGSDAETCEWPVGPWHESHPCGRPATRLLVRYPVQDLAARFESERRAYCARHMDADREALAREAGFLVVEL